MNRLGKALILAALALSAGPPVFGQARSRVHKTRQPKNFEQFAVYWTAEAGWKTELLLRNNLAAQSLTVTPALRTADGTETALPAITISSNDVATVDLGAVIANAAPQLSGAYGSAVLRYTATVPHALYAAMMVELPGTPIEFHLDAFLQPTTWVTGSREGIWWLPRSSVKDWLILTNTSASPLATNLILYDSSGKAWQQTVALNARQTVRLSVRSLLQQSGLAGSFGGIKVDVANGAGYLDTAHVVFDEQGGFLALMKMFDHNPNATLIQRSLTDKQWTIRAPMLALTNPDPALSMPAGATLQPAIFLRNASPSAYTAQVTFNWRSGTITGKSGTAVPLQPYATSMIDVAALQANGTIPAAAQWAYVSISAPIQPDNMLAVAASFDATGKLGAQTPFTDQVSNHWEGGKWEVDANHDTIIAVGNAGTTASKTQATLYYNSGQGMYQVEQTLGPDEQLWLDVGKLISNQVADKNGKTIPSDVTWGTYELRSLIEKQTVGLFEGKLVADKTYGYAVHGCGFCCGYSPDPYMGYDPFNLILNGSDYQEVWDEHACTGVDYNITYDFESGSYGAYWQTGNTQIATANWTLISGVGVGSTSNLASGYIESSGPRGCGTERVIPEGGVNVNPFITSMSPQAGAMGTTVPVTITGGGFGANPTVTTNGQISIQNVQVNQAQTQITANFVISSVATTANYAVVVTNAGGQAVTSFYITASCTTSIVTPSQTVQCDGQTVWTALLVIGGSNVVNVTNTDVSDTIPNYLTVAQQGNAYPYSGINCPAGDICWAQNYIGYTNNKSNSANINWNAQVFCSNSPYPSQVVNQSATITCSQ